MTGRIGADEEGAKSISVAGLSPLFDSAAATMRLAALTATSEDVDELSKTFNMARPSAEVIRQAAPTVKAARPSLVQGQPESLPEPGSGNLILVIIALLVLLGFIGFIISR